MSKHYAHADGLGAAGHRELRRSAASSAQSVALTAPRGCWRRVCTVHGAGAKAHDLGQLKDRAADVSGPGIPCVVRGASAAGVPAEGVAVETAAAAAVSAVRERIH